MNVLNAPELCILKWYIVCHVNFTTQFFKKSEPNTRMCTKSSRNEENKKERQESLGSQKGCGEGRQMPERREAHSSAFQDATGLPQV